MLTTDYIKNSLSDKITDINDVVINIINSDFETRKINLSFQNTRNVLMQVQTTSSSSTLPAQHEIDDVLDTLFRRSGALDYGDLLRDSMDPVLSTTERIKFSFLVTKSPTLSPSRSPAQSITFQPTSRRDKFIPIVSRRSRDYDDFFYEDHRKTNDY